MPTYRYECDGGHEFEVEQRITAAPLERCCVEVDAKTTLVALDHISDMTTPCGAPCERIISGGNGFVLLGAGWGREGYQK